MKISHTLFKLKITVHHKSGELFISESEPMVNDDVQDRLYHSRNNVAQMLSDEEVLSTATHYFTTSGDPRRIVLIPRELVDYVEFEVIVVDEEEV